MRDEVSDEEIFDAFVEEEIIDDYSL